MCFEVLFYFLEIDISAEELAEGGDGFVGDTAGDDESEVAHVGCDVERQAVEGDPFMDADADGGHFGAVHPDAGKSFHALALKTVFSEYADNHFFEGAQIPSDGTPPLVEIEDGIGHELSGAVIRNVSPAIHLDDFDSFLRIALFRKQEMFGMRVTSESNYGCMFKQEQRIRGAMFFDGQPAHSLLFEHFQIRNGLGNMNTLDFSGHSAM